MKISTISKHLDKDEIVVLTRIPHWITQTKSIIFSALGLGSILIAILLPSGSGQESLFTMGILAFMIAGIFRVPSEIKRRNNKLIVTSQRVIYSFGVVRTSMIEIPLKDIQGIEIEQSYPGKFFEYGDIFIRTQKNLQPLFKMPKPLDIKRCIQDQINKKECKNQNSQKNISEYLPS